MNEFFLASETAPLSGQLADYLGRLDPAAPAAVRAALVGVAEAVAAGHVCIDLAAISASGTDVLPPLPQWEAELRASRLVGEPGVYAPLILDSGHRLYLARYWYYEKELAEDLGARAALPQPPDENETAALRKHLDHLFATTTTQPDWQKAAAAAAVLQRFCVISGGPGTGKTSTVLRLLAALQLQAGEPLRIALAAPTGKAAARMQEAICSGKATLPVADSILDSIPETAVTLHRLLGSRPDSVTFRYHRGHPLTVDVVVVDEASMIDLALMAKLVAAVPPSARLILLGDKDQLASVEAGAVFSDLCADQGYSAAFRARVLAAAGVDIGATEAAPILGNAVMLLTHSYRFQADSGIGELARRINAGAGAETVALLDGGHCPDIGRCKHTPATLLADLQRGYGAFFEAVRTEGSVTEVFAAFNRFRALVLQREGPVGMIAVNRLLEDWLRRDGRARWGDPWYPGRPVMISRNDYGLNLFNGDIGIALPGEGGLRVFFEAVDGATRSYPPARLPAHETVYAMTVHKSQGSEFEEVLVLLPEQRSELLTRPLLYTAVTRARRRVMLAASRAVLETAVRTLPERTSGLRERLQGVAWDR